MCPIPLYDMVRNSKDSRLVRFRMCRYTVRYGVKPTARHFGTTVKTVRKWLSRWDGESLEGLEDRSRAPRSCPHRIAGEVEERIVVLRTMLPTWGARRLKRDFDLLCSEQAIARVLRQHGLIKKRRRKHQKKRDLRALKAAWPLFSRIVVDTKDLADILTYWSQMRRFGLPTTQYTAREVVSGCTYVAFAQERSLSCAQLFAQRIIEHLAACGVNLANTTWQTDNGSEFIDSWNATKDSAFTEVIESVPGQKHYTIPPGAKTYQSDVETVHRLIEDEFYQIEAFYSRKDFLKKAISGQRATSGYQLFFNVARKNSYKRDRTPLEIIKEKRPALNPRVILLPPVFLDELFNQKLKQKNQRGDHVPSQP
jgi:transposase